MALPISSASLGKTTSSTTTPLTSTNTFTPSTVLSTGKSNEQVLAESTAIAQRIAASTGATYTPPSGILPINSETTKPETLVTPTSPSLTSNGYGTTPPPPETPETPALTPAQQKLQSAIEEIQRQNTEAAGRTTYQEQQEQAAGIPGLTSLARDLSNQLKQAQQEAAIIYADPNQSGQSRGISQAQADREKNEALRQNSIKSNLINAQFQIAQGNLQSAQDSADRATNLKYAPIEASIKAAKENLDLIINSPEYTTQEKAQARAEQAKQDAKQATVETAKQNERDLKLSLLDMMNKYRLAGITLNDTLETANTKIVGSDQYRQEQQELKLSNAKRAEELSTGGSIGNVPTEFSTLANNIAGLVPATKGKVVKDNINRALASGNYVQVYAEIGNAVEDGLTGTNKTKFADARTDYGVLTGMGAAIQAYADGGGDMGLLKGTEEEIKRKLGISSGKASVLATQLWREFQTYRSNMTGAAFTPQESRDYASVNPTLGKSLDLNLGVIKGALNQLENRITSTINARVPLASQVYSKISGGSSEDKAKTSVIEYVKSNPAYLSVVNNAFRDNPNWTYADVIQLLPQ